MNIKNFYFIFLIKKNEFNRILEFNKMCKKGLIYVFDLSQNDNGKKSCKSW